VSIHAYKNSGALDAVGTNIIGSDPNATTNHVSLSPFNPFYDRGAFLYQLNLTEPLVNQVKRSAY
jgi:hypothetical protein